MNGCDYVYFLLAPEVAKVKIGTCGPNKLTTRLSAICTGCPTKLVLLGLIEGGDSSVELSIHSRFHHLRIHGEWFIARTELLEFIEKNAKVPSCLRSFDARIREALMWGKVKVFGSQRDNTIHLSEAV